MTEDERFDILSKSFKVASTPHKEGDEAAWSLLTNRQHEIMDAEVSKEKKVEALNYLLNEIDRIFPQSHKFYCQILQQCLQLTQTKEPWILEFIAKQAYMHKRYADISDYGKIIHDAGKKYETLQKLDPENIEHFPKYLADIKTAYKKYINNQKKNYEREIREERLREIDFYLNEVTSDSLEKLHLIDEALELLQEKYFVNVKDNKKDNKEDEIKYNRTLINDIKENYYCKHAEQICREELFDEDTAKYYEQDLGFYKYEKNADQAFLHTKEGNTEENKRKYMKKYHSGTPFAEAKSIIIRRKKMPVVFNEKINAATLLKKRAKGCCRST